MRLAGRPPLIVKVYADEWRWKRLYAATGAHLASVHRVAQEAFGYVVTRVVDPEPTNAASMSRQFDKKLAEHAALGGDPALHDAVRRAVDRGAAAFGRCTAPVLCHDDLHEGNLLVDRVAGRWEVTGFVDVENAVAADPLLDLATTLRYSVRGDADKRAGLLEGYGDLPDDAEERLALYELYHALELWDWFASTGETAPLPGIADDLWRLVR